MKPIKPPSTIKEASALGYNISSEVSEATGKERGDWHGEECREGRLLLTKYGKLRSIRSRDGSLHKVDGRVISELVFPYTATLRFGKPRPRRKGELL